MFFDLLNLIYSDFNMKKKLLITFLFGLFVSSVWSLTDGYELTMFVDPGTMVNISRTEGSGSKCTVCLGKGGTKPCQSQSTFTEAGEVSVTFTCAEPWKAFTVEIIKSIECTSGTCKQVVTPMDSKPLFEFNRTFHWCLKSPVRMTFHADFSRTGLTQIGPSETCPDGHTYNFVALETTKNVLLGLFCAGGTISGIQILNGGKVALSVPRRKTLEAKPFEVSWGEDIKSLAVVNVYLPNSQSSQEFLSPNYPSSFPDDDLMTWNFNVPPHYEVTVTVLDYSEPRCQKKDPGIEYAYDTLTFVRKLSDPQPTGREGSFKLSLRNCEMDMVRTRAEALGLALHFRVSAVRTGQGVSCVVDLSEEKSLSLHIAKKAADSPCDLKLDGVSKASVTVPPGKKSTLLFKDCPEEDLLLTVNQTIGCEPQVCPSLPVPLTVPSLERCLPKSLKSINWNLQTPGDSTVELWAYMGTLRQSLPGQECNSSVRFSVVESDGASIGEFCPGGAIAEVQVHGNVTVNASPRSGQFLPQNFQTFFKVAFSEEIPETYIFHVRPKKDETILVATPGWPGGMKPTSTASWIAQFPSSLDALLTFTQVSQPKCGRQHTSIQVQTLGSEEELYSRRDDEKRKNTVAVPESFYLNASNCLPEKGSFSLMAEITLSREKRIILPVILGVVGVLLVGMIIALVAVCLVIRKKKKQMNPDVSTYNPNGHSFLPGLHGLPKSPGGDEHIYEYIEDTLVYGHLLRDAGVEMEEYGKPAVDTYRTFDGPVDPRPLKDPDALNDEPNKDAEMEVGIYRPFIPSSDTSVPATQPAGMVESTLGGKPADTESEPGDRKLVENELYSLDGGDGGSGGPAAPLSPCSEALQGPWV